MHFKKTTGVDGWTYSWESKKIVGAVLGYAYSAFGIALLFYRPEKRLSVSIWCPIKSVNIRLWGPRKLSWQR